jgi:hypothetical protein
MPLARTRMADLPTIRGSARRKAAPSSRFRRQAVLDAAGLQCVEA